MFANITTCCTMLNRGFTNSAKEEECKSVNARATITMACPAFNCKWKWIRIIIRDREILTTTPTLTLDPKILNCFRKSIQCFATPIVSTLCGIWTITNRILQFLNLLRSSLWVRSGSENTASTLCTPRTKMAITLHNSFKREQVSTSGKLNK